MAARKRSEAQRENDLVRIARLYLDRVPQHEIAHELGLSRQQIGYDLRVLFKRWREAALADFDEALGRELSRLDLIEREAWAGWERSVGEAVSKREFYPPKKGAKGKPLRNTTGEGYVLAAFETKDQTGDPRFLAVILQTVAARAKLLGLTDFGDKQGDQYGERDDVGTARSVLERLLLSGPAAAGAGGGAAVPK